MSLWNDSNPPVLYPNAVATPAGWADPITGELYVAVSGLSTVKGGAAELTHLRLLTSVDPFNTGQALQSEVYAKDEYMVLEAIFSEPVTWTGDAPQIVGNLRGNSRTFAYYLDATDVLAHTADKITSVTISGGGTNYQIGDKITFTVGGSNTGSSAEAVVSAVGGSNAISGITMVSNGSSYDVAPTVVVHSGYVKSLAVGGSGNGGYLNGDVLTFTTAGSTTAATGYVVTNAAGNVSRAVISNGGGVGYTSNPTVGITSVAGSGNTITATTSYGAGATLVAVLGTPANGIGTNRILFRYQIVAGEYAASNEITFTSPVGSSGSTTWTDTDSAAGLAAAATAYRSGGVTSFSGITAGTGYTAPPLIQITSATGTGATAVAVLDKGVNTVVPVLAGYGYRTIPSVTLTGDTGNADASVTAVLSTTGSVVDITVDTPGVGYQVAPVVSGGGNCTLTPALAATGKVVDVTRGTTGSGYRTAPTVTPGSGNATLTASLSTTGKVVDITVNTPGVGYQAAPVVTTSGNVGFTAVLAATGKIVDVVQGTPGNGYRLAQEGGNLSGMTAGTATLSAVLSTTGKVVDVTIGNVGSNYVTGDIITPSSGTFAGTLIAPAGAITGINITNPGSYAVAPTFTFPVDGGRADGAVTAILGFPIDHYTVGGTNSGFAAAPTCTVPVPTAPVLATGGTVTQEVITTVLGKAIGHYAVGGSNTGYTVAPSVTVAAPETPAKVTGGTVTTETITSTTLGFPIASYAIGGVNSGFSTPPTFTVADPVAPSASISGVTVPTETLTAVLGKAIATYTLGGVNTGHSVAPTLTVAPPTTPVLVTGGTVTTELITAILGKTVASYTVGAAGTGFLVAPGLTVAAPTALSGTVVAAPVVTATASSTLKNLDGVKSITVTNPGSGYVSDQAAVFTNAPGDITGASAAATPVVSSVVDHITVTTGGAGYWLAPAVTFTGGTPGTAATATATVVDGAVSAVTMVTHGIGYNATPAIGFTAAAETPTLTFDSTQYVSGVTITGTGTGYYTRQTLVFDSGIGAGTIIADRTGNVTGVVLTAGGAYASAPTITITAPPIWSGSVVYSLGNIVYHTGTSARYVSLQNTNLNQTPGSAPTYWTLLVDVTLAAIMGSSIVGDSYVEGRVPTVSSSTIVKDRFGAATTQTAFVTGDWFTVTFNTSRVVYVAGPTTGATAVLGITSGAKVLTYFSGSGTTALHFTYQLVATDIASATGVTSPSPIILASGTTIKDVAGNNLTLTFTPATCTAVTFN